MPTSRMVIIYYTLIDLLVDVKVYEDGTYEVLDLDELDEAYEKGLIQEEQRRIALEKLEKLLEVIKKGEFPPLVGSGNE